MYAAREDLGLSEELLAWLTGAAPDYASADDDRIEAALQQASRKVDRYISVRYALPWVDTEGQLKAIAVALARRALYGLRPDGPDIPPSITEAARDAEAELRDLRDGKTLLTGVGAGSPTPSVGYRAPRPTWPDEDLP